MKQKRLIVCLVVSIVMASAIFFSYLNYTSNTRYSEDLTYIRYFYIDSERMYTLVSEIAFSDPTPEAVLDYIVQENKHLFPNKNSIPSVTVKDRIAYVDFPEDFEVGTAESMIVWFLSSVSDTLCLNPTYGIDAVMFLEGGKSPATLGSTTFWEPVTPSDEFKKIYLGGRD